MISHSIHCLWEKRYVTEMRSHYLTRKYGVYLNDSIEKVMIIFAARYQHNRHAVIINYMPFSVKKNERQKAHMSEQSLQHTENEI